MINPTLRTRVNAVARHSFTVTWNVAVPIGKEDLLPGDAMDLETWRDPARYGHIRLFEAVSTAQPQAVHRVRDHDAGLIDRGGREEHGGAERAEQRMLAFFDRYLKPR